MRDKIKGKPPLDLYQAVREIACRLDEVIDYLNNNDPAFGNVYVRTFNGKTGDVVGVSSVNGQTGDVTVQGGGAVDSVNGKTGDVTLTGNDISLSAAGSQSISSVIGTLYGPTNAPPYPVTSVNAKTGPVVIKGSDISVSDSNDETVAAELAKKYDATNPPPYPVTSVNGQTGDVEISAGGGAVDSVNGKTGAVLLTASDINATAGGTVQQNIDTFSSDIEELSDEVNGKYSASNPPPYPVKSVNGNTGNVAISYMAQSGVRVSVRPDPTGPGMYFYEVSIGYPRNSIRVRYASQPGGFPILEQLYRTDSGENATQIYTAANPPPANLPLYSAPIGSGTVDIPSNTICAIYGLRFPLTGSLPTGNTGIVQFTSPNISSIQPLNASVSSGYIQTTLSRGSNYLYLTVTNNLPGESFSGNVILYLYSTVTTTLSVVNG